MCSDRWASSRYRPQACRQTIRGYKAPIRRYILYAHFAMYKFGRSGGVLTTKFVEGKLYIVLSVRKRTIQLSARCWLTFVLQFGDVEEAVSKVVDGSQYVNFMRHIGSGYYVSVRTGNEDMHLRRYYVKGNDLKPTREFLDFDVDDWDDIRRIAIQLLSDIPQLINVQPCFCGGDRFVWGYLECGLCRPFQNPLNEMQQSSSM